MQCMLCIMSDARGSGIVFGAIKSSKVAGHQRKDVKRERGGESHVVAFVRWVPACLVAAR
jgi:hypothetical protein